MQGNLNYWNTGGIQAPENGVSKPGISGPFFQMEGQLVLGYPPRSERINISYIAWVQIYHPLLTIGGSRLQMD